MGVPKKCTFLETRLEDAADGHYKRREGSQ